MMSAPASTLAPSDTLRRVIRSLRRRLPEGGGLPDEVWRRRHRGILVLLSLHVPGIIVFGLVQGEHWGHLLPEVAPIAAAALTAGRLSHRRTISTVLVSVGLVTSSALIVHLSQGVIEAHFHFFVMVGVVVLYQEWWPFLVAIGYVVLHHGTAGTFAPHDVYNHPAALNGPWKWATIHGVFILAMSTAGIVTWRLNESLRRAAVLSERHLAEAQQLAHLGSWEVDVEAGLVTSSDELKRLFALEDDQERSLERFLERVHPDDRQDMVRSMAEALDQRSRFARDFRVVTSSGEVRWLHGRGEPVLDGTGSVTKLRGTTQDISERKQAEAALSKESMVRHLLQAVASAANEAETVPAAMQVAVEQVCRFTGWPVGHGLVTRGQGGPLVSARVWHLDEPDRFEVFRQASENRVFEVGVGLPGRVSARSAPAWIADLAADGSFPRRDAACEAGLLSGFAFPVLVGQEVAGVLEFFSTHSEPIDDQLLEVMAQVGKQLGLVLERTRVADALRASEERSRTIVETASDAFVGMDANGTIIDWNQRAEGLFGWSREEAIGRQLAETIIPEELRTAHREGLRRYLRTGSGPVLSGPVAFEAIRRDGTRFPVELAVWEVRSETACVFSAFVRDITHHKEAEEALAAARDHALDAARLKSEFMANMSHEIRTPMNGVIGLTDLLLDTGLDATQRRYAEGIQSAGEALLTLINDVLDFSKAEAGKMDLDEVDFDLQELVEEATSLLAGPAAEKGLELIGYCYPSVPTQVRGDPGRLRQVLLNLVGNAVKFTERGEVVVRARLAVDDGETITIRFEVVDTGIGIDPATQGRLFQSFTQADASTTRRYGGTGLGLALSKRLVEVMGGEIGVESQLGTGSTFWVTVPLTRQLGGPAERAARRIPPSLFGVRALVVDDNATNRLVLEQLLVNWGMRPDPVESPRRALDLARAAAGSGDPYELALVDMQMPEMSGVALAGAMARDPALGEPRVILLSSAFTLTAQDRGQNGVAISLMKPVRQSELLNAVLEALTSDGESAPETHGESKDGDEDVGSRGHVLVVEDNAINRTVAVGILTKLGYRADIAANGREAIAAVARRTYSAVLMDCQMPEMDGYQATREIRDRENGTQRVPIVAMTASAMEGDRERCLAAGMDDYVAKPIRIEYVDAALARLTGANASPSTAPPPVPDSDDLLDRSHLEQLRTLGAATGNTDLLAQLVAEFLAQTMARLSELSNAARRQDTRALIRVAHTVTGSAAAVGARRLAAVSAALEAAAEAGDFAAVGERLQVLEAEFESASTVLKLEVPQPAAK